MVAIQTLGFLYSSYLIIAGLLAGGISVISDNLDSQSTKHFHESTQSQLTSVIPRFECVRKSDCGEHGKCVPDPEYPDVTNATVCECDDNYIDRDGTCNYQQRDKLTAFLISLLVGWTGADWFYLSRGDAVYIFAGVMKLVSLGGCGIWATVDWIRVLADAFPDGNGVDLSDW